MRGLPVNHSRHRPRSRERPGLKPPSQRAHPQCQTFCPEFCSGLQQASAPTSTKRQQWHSWLTFFSELTGKPTTFDQTRSFALAIDETNPCRSHPGPPRRETQCSSSCRAEARRG